MKTVEDVEDVVDNKVFRFMRQEEIDALVINMIRVYKYILGIEEFVNIKYCTIHHDHLDSVYMSEISRRINALLYYVDTGRAKLEDVNAELLPDLVELLNYMAKEGESLFPEMEIIAKHAGEDTVRKNDIVALWQTTVGITPTVESIKDGYDLVSSDNLDCLLFS